ncbi:MAG: hypothetical protein MUC48_09300 [Leptolyngbya sp. Prado105]|jgi:CII-binding regulator of phage lambda lysogenization HflD|nr:hypothetical protein [Leptolyngbya sp. Prado105]
MTTKTRESKALEKAEARIKGMQEINSPVDLGNGISLDNYITKAEALRQQIEAHNTLLKTLEQSRQSIAEAEQELNDFSEHILLSVAALYGKQSKQYERAGGKRKQSGGWVDRN